MCSSHSTLSCFGERQFVQEAPVGKVTYWEGEVCKTGWLLPHSETGGKGLDTGGSILPVYRRWIKGEHAGLRPWTL